MSAAERRGREDAVKRHGAPRPRRRCRTLWGAPRGDRASARLADGAVVRWHRRRWSASADMTFAER